jgi:peptide/nickel transport system ATP-binding protein
MVAEPSGTTKETSALLEVRGLTMSYAARRLLGTGDGGHVALQNVSLELHEGKTLALVGPSGSGKSSLARCLVLLEQPSSGEILYRGNNLLKLGTKELKMARREIQLIFQDSASALNPRLTIQDILEEPLIIQKICASSEQMREKICWITDQVELPRKWLVRRPLDLSGGQRQRVAIARSLVLQPKVLILDEALSSLDLSTQNQIANLLLDLQAQYSMAHLLITHDLRIGSLLADQVAVMSAGRIIRRCSSGDLFTSKEQGGACMLPPSPSSEETSRVPLVISDK